MLVLLAQSVNVSLMQADYLEIMYKCCTFVLRAGSACDTKAGRDPPGFGRVGLRQTFSQDRPRDEEVQNARPATLRIFIV